MFSGSKKECERCKGLFEPLSRQATQNGMGPWFIRDEANPFRPGCSYATMRMLVARKRIVAESVIRGPSTRQFWTFAKNTPGIGHLLGECHACHRTAMPEATRCPQCNASFEVEEDRQYLGLAEVRVIPGQPASAPSAARVQPANPVAPAFEPAPVVSLTESPEMAEAPAEEAGPHTEFEPIRNPARPLRSSSPMTDAQIDELLRRSSASDRATRSATVVVVLIVAAVLAVVLLIVLGVLVYAGGGTPATTPTAPTTTSPAAPTTPAAVTPTTPSPATPGTGK